MVYYDSSALYIQRASSLTAKIARIDAVISAMEDIALTAAATGGNTEYSLDNGQSKLRLVYRDPSDIAYAISAYEKIKQRYVNRLNGPMFRLVDGKNFLRRIG